MREKILIISGFLLSFSIGFMIGQILLIRTQKVNSFVNQVVDRSLDKYTIDNLSKVDVPSSDIKIEKELKDYPNFVSCEFLMNFDPSLGGKTKKNVSGLINVPKEIPSKGAPLIVMIRGYVDSKDYFIGNGTINSSLFFAKNGFITIAPDFLGYGDSDKEPSDIFEARFQTYTTLMTLLKSVDKIPGWDGKNVFIWAHSNGGQIALTTLETTGVAYPTVLWAPVSAPFPFSILYYTDEADDKGKSLRRELSRFENVYNTDFYSLTNYLDRIKAPIELNQGTSDDAVPVQWSDNLAKILKDDGLDIKYNKIPGADHQMTPLWDFVIQKDLEFFKSNLK